jgi:plasmid stabilization system protein ParE
VTKLIWSPQAIHDLEAIRAYIVADSPVYAELMVRRIVSAIERLAVFPESGRIVPERSTPTLREVIAGPYRVVYRLRSERIEIVSVFRGSRLFPDID